jgi:hypothetical protein
MPSRQPLPARVPAAIPALVALVVGACVVGGTPAATTTPPGATSPAVDPSAPAAAPSGSARTDPDAIDHPTGSGDIVLRAETRGGFVRLETVMSRVPEFTLYGDGRALVLPPDVDEAAGGGLNPGSAGGEMAIPTLREVQLTEDEVQALLRFALVDGRLGTARDVYPGGNMDAASTVFELHADGADRSILVTGLTDDSAPGPDAVSIRAFADLVARLRSIATDADYATNGVVAVIAETEAAPGVVVRDWPFSDLQPVEFRQPADDAATPFPSRLLTAAEAAEAEEATGGVPSLTSMKAPDGRTYGLLLRAALPEELAEG